MHDETNELKNYKNVRKMLIILGTDIPMENFDH